MQHVYIDVIRDSTMHTYGLLTLDLKADNLDVKLSILINCIIN